MGGLERCGCVKQELGLKNSTTHIIAKNIVSAPLQKVDLEMDYRCIRTNTQKKSQHNKTVKRKKQIATREQ